MVRLSQLSVQTNWNVPVRARNRQGSHQLPLAHLRRQETLVAAEGLPLVAVALRARCSRLRRCRRSRRRGSSFPRMPGRAGSRPGPQPGRWPLPRSSPRTASRRPSELHKRSSQRVFPLGAQVMASRTPCDHPLPRLGGKFAKRINQQVGIGQRGAGAAGTDQADAGHARRRGRGKSRRRVLDHHAPPRRPPDVAPPVERPGGRVCRGQHPRRSRPRRTNRADSSSPAPA